MSRFPEISDFHDVRKEAFGLDSTDTDIISGKLQINASVSTDIKTELNKLKDAKAPAQHTQQ